MRLYWVRRFAISGAAALLIVAQVGAMSSRAAGGPNWWKVELHEHSAFSGDARADVGIDVAKAKQANYNALFLTDHDRGSGFAISGSNGNFLAVTDGLSNQWTEKLLPSTLPAGSSGIVPTAVGPPSPVRSGASSIHVQASAATPTVVSSVAYNNRGVGLSSGNVTLEFWAYPLSYSPATSAGLDVSVALGGDLSAGPKPYGYTTSAGNSQIGKSTVLAWQIGKPRTAPPRDGTTDIYTNQLPSTTGVWNHYVIDVKSGQVQWTPAGGATSMSSSTGIDGLDPGDAPAPYVVLSYVKMEAAASKGSAEGYFDDFSLKVSNPQCPAAEFVTRNQLLPQFNGQNLNHDQFQIFPAREMGETYHANQFNFGITQPTQYSDTFSDSVQDDSVLCALTNGQQPNWQFANHGTDNIANVQNSGYPAQLNHPGDTEKIDTALGVLANNAWGADAIEARTVADYTATWDALLQKGIVLMGTQGSDAHEGPGPGSPSMYIDAPTLTLDDLMHSYFEGRMYGAPGDFSGRIVFNLDGSTSPYPARYPIYVPSTQPTATVNLSIDNGLKPGQIVRWFTYSQGGSLATTDTAETVPYNHSFTVPLSGSFSYVRAAVYDPSLIPPKVPLLANTEPIIFKGVTGMPANMSVRVDSIAAPTGKCDCTSAMTKGISSTPTWNSGSSTLTVPLTNPAGSGVSMLVQSPGAPSSLTIDGTPVVAATSLTAYQTGSGSSWFYDSVGKVLYVRDVQVAGTSTVVASFAASGDTTPPNIPTGLSATATSSSEIDLSWAPSTDNAGGSGVAGYNIYRGGTRVNVAPVTVTNFADTGLTASTTYNYSVSAVDNSGNESAQSSPPKSATTLSGGGGGGPIAFIQSQSASGNTATLPLTLKAPSKAGNTLVATIGLAAGGSAWVRSVVDSSGGTWTPGPIGFLSGTNSRVEIWYRVGAPAVSTVTITLSAAKSAAATVSEWSGISTASALDASSYGSTASGTTATSWTLNAPNAPDLILGATNYPASATATLTANGFTSLPDFTAGTAVHGHTAYTLAATGGNYAATWTLSAPSGGSGGAILALRGSSTTSDTTPPTTGITCNGGSCAGNFSSPVTVTFTPSDPGGSGSKATYYTLDGSTPTTASSLYSGPFSISSTTTIKYFSVDNAGNAETPKSTTITVTNGGGGTTSFTATADAYVDANTPTTPYGKSLKLRVDSDQTVNSFLRFSIAGLSGTVTGVQLKIYAASNLAAGFNVSSAADTWDETTVTFATEPAIGSLITNSPAATMNAYVIVTLPPSTISGNGTFDFALTGRSATALALASRESGTPPQLFVTTA